MLKKIKEFFMGKPAEVAPTPALVETAPYKVPESAATTTIPLVAESAPVVAEVVAPVVAEVVAPAKKPRKPRAPKVVAAPAKAVKEKAPAKAPKLTVVKTAKASRSKKS